MEEYRRYQIPAFGNWELSDGLPITQYFEDAKQGGGLIRYADYGMDHDLYSNDFIMVTPTMLHYTKTNGGSRRYQAGKRAKKHSKVCELTEPASPPHSKPSKPVDEDLYKIPSDLVSRRKGKAEGFFTRCFMPSCA